MTRLPSAAARLPVQAGATAFDQTWLASERALFLIATLCAAGMMWLAPRLPMIDLPQHAAQVALWRDLLLGQSPWADMVRINLATPYLIGYGTMLPLSMLFSMEVTTRLVLTVAFLAFVFLCTRLRAQLGADRRLDWLFLLSFFGMCWKWGFFTFLVSSPVFLLFLLLALRQSQEPVLRRNVALVATGTVLLFSHGLLFLGACFIGGLVMLESVWAQRGRAIVARFVPYVVLFIIMVAFRLATQQLEGAISNNGFDYGTPIWLRPKVWLTHISDAEDFDNFGILQVVTLLALLAPLYFRARPNTSPAFVMLGGLMVILCLVPAYAFETGGIFYRFVLFLPPFIAFACRAPEEVSASRWRSTAAMATLALAVSFVLVTQAGRIAAFARESQTFDTVMTAAQPGKRALAVILDEESPAAVNERAYGHWVLWYQAAKHGFVDFNFAFFPPQVIRFRKDHWPVRDETSGQAIGTYMWEDRMMLQYTYLFVRSSPLQLEKVKSMTTCALTTVASDGPWYLLERGACPG